MPYFKSKPRTIRADQYRKGQALPEGVKLGNLGIGNPEAYVISERGLQVIHDGDWVMEGEKGFYYPCPDIIFKDRYEPV